MCSASTKHPPDTRPNIDRRGQADAEIEVTPEMEAAGIRALSGYDPEWDSSGEFAINVFRAMTLAFEQKRRGIFIEKGVVYGLTPSVTPFPSKQTNSIER